MIRDAELRDAAAICQIYNYYIQNPVITFEEAILTTQEMTDRIVKYSKLYPYLVYELNSEVVAYAYAAPYHARSAYRYTVESTIYVRCDTCKRGIGFALYSELIQRLGMRPVHSIIAGIALPNPGSVGLHEKLHFVKVAHTKEVGRKFDTWIDVGLWQYSFPPDHALQ